MLIKLNRLEGYVKQKHLDALRENGINVTSRKDGSSIYLKECWVEEDIPMENFMKLSATFNVTVYISCVSLSLY